jgi:hypothetical protein
VWFNEDKVERIDDSTGASTAAAPAAAQPSG